MKWSREGELRLGRCSTERKSVGERETEMKEEEELGFTTAYSHEIGTGSRICDDTLSPPTGLQSPVGMAMGIVGVYY